MNNGVKPETGRVELSLAYDDGSRFCPSLQAGECACVYRELVVYKDPTSGLSEPLQVPKARRRTKESSHPWTQERCLLHTFRYGVYVQ